MSAINTKNFECLELQILNVTTTSAKATFNTSFGQGATDLMVVNSGASPCLLCTGNYSNIVAAASATANTTRQTYIPAGAVMVLNKVLGEFVAAICDSGSTTLYLHAGNGS